MNKLRFFYYKHIWLWWQMRKINKSLEVVKKMSLEDSIIWLKDTEKNFLESEIIDKENFAKIFSNVREKLEELKNQ